MDWFSMAWNRASDFNGRSRRKEYWMFTLLNTLICIVLLIPSIAFARIWIGTHLRPLNIYNFENCLLELW
jgi:uncharacterized membrane protein YhaH (DUF805 family)